VSEDFEHLPSIARIIEHDIDGRIDANVSRVRHREYPDHRHSPLQSEPPCIELTRRTKIVFAFVTEMRLELEAPNQTVSRRLNRPAQ
jgi:hypothetical protein